MNLFTLVNVSLKYLTSITMLILLISCNPDKKSQSATPQAKPISNYKITKSLPHDELAFTQGLIYLDGSIIESTGQYGTSWISVLDTKTLQYDKKVLVPNTFFGEGITILNDKIYQLTYKSRVGFVYDLETFEKIGEFDYPSKIREGWGITTDGSDLIVSDGTSNLYYLDPISFDIKKTLIVQSANAVKSNLNELEYVDGCIYSNIWQSNKILKIEASSGLVETVYDLTSIYLLDKNKNPKIDVLNGIAYDQATNRLIVTGKYWPNYYYLTLRE